MIRRTLAVLLALALISSCGQKGPLFRPGPGGKATPATSLAGFP